MNTEIKIKMISDLGTTPSYNLIDQAYDQFAKVMKDYSRFDKNSELSKLNQKSGQYSKISKELFSLIKTAIDISQQSKYRYDPTIIDILERYGYKKNSKIRNISQEQFKQIIKDRPKISEIELNEDDLSIKLVKNQKIDLGSIGKGFAVDLAAEVLKKSRNFMINAGGDVYAKGQNDINQRWKIGLNIPNSSEEIFGYIELDGHALASSGNWAIKYKDFAHIIDPMQNEKSNQIQQCFVLNKSAKLADAYATMLFLTGREGLKKLEENEIGGLIIENNKIFTNSHFPKFN